MSVSNSFDFNMTIDEIIRKAAQKAGGGLLDGEELKDSLKSLNLVILDMMNDAIPLALIQQYSIALSSGVSEYTLDQKVNDLHSVVLGNSTQDNDLGIERYSLAKFNSISNKTTTGKPSLYAVERNYDCLNVRVWPVPDQTYYLNTYAFMKPDDAQKYTQNMRIQSRYLPALIAGLAAEIAWDRQAPLEKVLALREDYNGKLGRSQHEDRERVGYRVVPSLNSRI